MKRRTLAILVTLVAAFGLTLAVAGPAFASQPAPAGMSDTPYSTYVNLGWSAVSGSSVYHYQVERSSDDSLVASANTANTYAHNVGPLTASTGYRWRVSSYTPTGAWTGWKSFTTTSSGGGGGGTFSCTTGPAPGGDCGPYSDPAVAPSVNDFPPGNTGDGPTTVENQAVGGNGWTSTLGANSPEDWAAAVNVTAAQASACGGCVAAYVSTQSDTYNNNDWSTGEPATVPLSDFSDVTSSYTSAMPAAASGVTAESAYDVWTNAWNGETMIWTDQQNRLGDTPGLACGTGQPANSSSPSDTYMGVVATNVSFGGTNGVPVESWDLCVNGTPAAADAVNDNVEYIWYLPGAQQDSGSVDVQAMVQYEISHGLLPANSGYTAINYGFEICQTNGTQNFSVAKYTITGYPAS